MKRILSLLIIFSMVWGDIARAMDDDEPKSYIVARQTSSIPQDKKRENQKETQTNETQPNLGNHLASQGQDSSTTSTAQNLLEQDRMAESGNSSEQPLLRNKTASQDKLTTASQDNKLFSNEASQNNGAASDDKKFILSVEDDYDDDERTPFLAPKEKRMSLREPIQVEDIFSNGESHNETLEESFKRLQRAEARPFFLKWVYMDHLLEKIAYSLLLRKKDVRGVSLKGEDYLPKEGNYYPLWIEGRGIPLKSGFTLARGVSGFRQGVEFVIERSLFLALQGLLGYQVYDQISQGKSFEPLKFLDILWKGDETSIKGALAVIVQNPEHAPYFLSFFAAPLLWGFVKSGLFARRALHDIPQKAVQVVEDFSLRDSEDNWNRLWKDNIRWLLPFHPIAREVNYLVYHLLLD